MGFYPSRGAHRHQCCRGCTREANPPAYIAGTTASAVLSRPGALPRLLAAVGHRSGGAEALPAALQAGATMARLPPALSFDDLSSLLAQVPPGSALSHHVHLPPLHFMHVPSANHVVCCYYIFSHLRCGKASVN